MKTKEITLISIFAAFWIIAETILGPVVGRFSLGPFTLHGVVNRIVGWMLMLILAKVTGRFGRITIMVLTASLATRLLRASALEALVVGVGYVFGGLLFDIIIFLPSLRNLQGKVGTVHVFSASFASGLTASAPYLLLSLFLVGPFGFAAASLIYTYSTVKGAVFSLLGTSVGLILLPRIAPLYHRSATSFETVQERGFVSTPSIQLHPHTRPED